MDREIEGSSYTEERHKRVLATFYPRLHALREPKGGKQMTPFTEWLRAQGRERADSVGELARAIAADPEAARLTKLSELLPLLMARPYTESRLEALRLARQEWEENEKGEVNMSDDTETTTPVPSSTPSSSVIRLWRRSPSGKPGYTISLVEGVTAAEATRLLELALELDRRLKSEAA